MLSTPYAVVPSSSQAQQPPATIVVHYVTTLTGLGRMSMPAASSDTRCCRGQAVRSPNLRALAACSTAVIVTGSTVDAGPEDSGPAIPSCIGALRLRGCQGGQCAEQKRRIQWMPAENLLGMNQSSVVCAVHVCCQWLSTLACIVAYRGNAALLRRCHGYSR